MIAFGVDCTADSQTRLEAFTEACLEKEITEIRALFSSVYAIGVVKVLDEYSSELCFGCELNKCAAESDQYPKDFRTDPKFHRCSMKKSKLLLSGSTAHRVWNKMDHDKLKAQWFQAIEKSRHVTKKGILWFFQVHFCGDKSEFLARLEDVAAIINKDY